MNPDTKRHALVIGASMGGLLAARTLLEHFDRVTLLERDAVPAPGGHRKGVPQGRHAHGLLGQGRLVLEELFPGLTAELEAQGASRGDLASESLWFHAAGFHCQYDSGITGLLVSRPLLEAQVRRRLLAEPRVELVTGVDVTGLTVTAAGSEVTGVRLRRTGSADAEETLPADLVVDASGRGSRLPAWLEALGFAPPPVDRVEIGLRYTTRVYRRDPTQLSGLKAVVKAGTPSSSRGGALLSMEGDRWILSMGGYAGDHAPLDDAGLRAYAHGLGAPQFAWMVEHGVPLSEPEAFHFPASVRHHYQRLRRFPAGLLAFGDALCSFNPVYGQGMTVAAMEAVALREALGEGPRDLARRFFSQASRIIDIPWTVVIGNDARVMGIARLNGLANRLLGAYLDRLHAAACTDATVALAFLRVANLMAPPTSLLAPRIVWRVWRAGGRTSRKAEAGLVLAGGPEA